MKKYLNNYLVALFAIIAMTVFSACSENNNTASTNDEFTSAIYEVSDPNTLTEFDIVLASESDAPNCKFRELPIDNSGKPLRGHLGRNDKMSKFHLGSIMRNLRLSEEQRTQLQGFMAEYRDCVYQSRLALHDAIQTIAEPFKAERDAIIADYRAGNITKEELRTKMSDLNARFKTAVEASTEIADARETLLNCRLTLIEKIEGILTAEQLEKWNKWKSRLN